MNLFSLGIWPRLGLALIPWLTGEVIDAYFGGCFFSESPFCIYYFHPPGMDLLFALLVLAPFMSTRSYLALRMLALLVLSVVVHSQSVSLLVGTRGSLDLPWIDSIFLNIVPIAFIASVVTVLVAALVCGSKMTLRLFVCSALAGIPVSAYFLLTDLAPDTVWLPQSSNTIWAVWHLSICIAFYYGRRQVAGTSA